jgi:hypothetical protein
MLLKCTYVVQDKKQRALASPDLLRHHMPLPTRYTRRGNPPDWLASWKGVKDPDDVSG